MKKTKRILGTLGFFLIVFVSIWAADRTTHAAELKPVIAPEIRTQDNTALQQAIFDAAETFGRGKCGNYTLAEKIGKQSLKDGVPASLLAAVAQTESNCNALAISNRGAVGLMQIRVSAWSKTIDFSRVNLFDPDQNLATGSGILKTLIARRGVHGAVLGYNCEDQDYAAQVLKLAGIR